MTSAERSKKWRQENPEKNAASTGNWRRNNPAKRKALRDGYEARHRPKYLAHKAIQNAVMRGRIVKPDNCSVCGKASVIEGHHPDYRKRLMVIWCCHDCHQAIHRGTKRGRC